MLRYIYFPFHVHFISFSCHISNIVALSVIDFHWLIHLLQFRVLGKAGDSWPPAHRQVRQRLQVWQHEAGQGCSGAHAATDYHVRGHAQPDVPGRDRGRDHRHSYGHL